MKEMISRNDYREIKILNKSGTVRLMENSITGELLVEKNLAVYDTAVYGYLHDMKPKGIPLIKDFKSEGDILVVLEEYIPGRTLEEVLKELGPPPEDRAVQIMLDLCSILAPLHSLYPAIVHRDIKLSNILLADSGEIYLLDFNAATEYSESKDQDTVLIGTTGYAAPEQYGFKASDPRADVYALGRVAQELFTGEKSLPENYNGPYKDVIQKCLKLDPKDRFKDAGVLRKAFSAKHSPSKQKWYIPPGFRSGNPFHMVIAVIGYFLAIVMFTPYSDGRRVLNTGADYLVLSFLVLEFLLITNYMNIHKQLSLTSDHRLPVRIVGVLLYSAVLFFAYVVIANILVYFGLIDLS